MSDNDNFATAINAGRDLAGVTPRIGFVNGIPVALVDDENGGMSVRVLSEALDAADARAPGPRDRRGTVQLSELDSLIAYVNRYKSEHTIAWADLSAFRVEAVFNDHPAGPADDDPAIVDAGWRNHRALYMCPRSPEWVAWTGNDGALLKQEVFADFIESRLEDLRAAEGYPKPLDVLQMARNLSIRTKGTFERSINPTTGDGVLVAKTETDATSTQIPRAFALGVPVFEGGTVYQIEARVRFSVSEGRAAFSYTLHRRKEIERDAFADIRNKVQAATGVLLLAGKP